MKTRKAQMFNSDEKETYIMPPTVSKKRFVSESDILNPKKTVSEKNTLLHRWRKKIARAYDALGLSHKAEFFIVTFLFMCVLGVVVYGAGMQSDVSFRQNDGLRAYSDPSVIGTNQSAQSIDSIIESISQVVIVPDEEPIVLLIDDVENLADKQAFFGQAENDDVLLLFSSSAVLYRPDIQKVVSAGAIAVQASDAFDSAEGG